MSRSTSNSRAAVKLYDFEAVYTFVRSGEDWRIAAITHNQIPDC